MAGTPGSSSVLTSSCTSPPLNRPTAKTPPKRRSSLLLNTGVLPIGPQVSPDPPGRGSPARTIRSTDSSMSNRSPFGRRARATAPDGLSTLRTSVEPGAASLIDLSQASIFPEHQFHSIRSLGRKQHVSGLIDCENSKPRKGLTSVPRKEMRKSVESDRLIEDRPPKVLPGKERRSFRSCCSGRPGSQN